MYKDNKELTRRLNLFYREIFDKYEKLNDENFENLRSLIIYIFSSFRPTEYKKEEYKNQIDDYLYPSISLVGLSKLYSKDMHIQYSFLMKVNEGIDIELNKNSHNKKKIK